MALAVGRDDDVALVNGNGGEDVTGRGGFVCPDFPAAGEIDSLTH
jgi:hypothetical protein